MWSNLNDSFSAITGTITNIRQSIPVIQPFGESDKIRELETKISLLKNEVGRHYEIALLYKNRWQKAEELVQFHTGSTSQIFAGDDIDLLAQLDSDGHQAECGAHPEPHQSAKENDAERASPLFEEVPLSSSPPQASSSFSDHLTDSEGTPRPTQPRSISELALDSATQTIHQLQDELKKMTADREHWQVLAKQKSSLQEELVQAKSQLEIFTVETEQARQRYAELVVSRDELLAELQELDHQHEQALAKVIRMRDDLYDRNQRLEVEVRTLKEQCAPDQVTLSHAAVDAVDDEATAVSTTADAGGEEERKCEPGDRLEDTTAIIHQQISPKEPTIDCFTQTELSHDAQTDADQEVVANEQESTSLIQARCTQLEASLRSIAAELATFVESTESDVPSVKSQTESLSGDEAIRSDLDLALFEHKVKRDIGQIATRIESLVVEKNELSRSVLTHREQHDLEICAQYERHIQELEHKVSTYEHNATAAATINVAPHSSADLCLTREEPEGATTAEEDNNATSSSAEVDAEKRRRQLHEQELESKVALLMLQNEQLEQEVRQLADQLSTLTTEHSSLESNLVDCQDENARLSKANEALEIELSKTNATLVDNCQLLEHVRADHLQAQDSLRKVYEELDQKKQQFEQQLCQLQSTVAERDELVKSLQTELSREANSKNDADQILTQKNVEIVSLSQELDRLRTHLVQVEESYTGELMTLENKLQQATQQCEQLEQANQNVQKFDEQIRNLCTQRDKARNEVSTLEDKLQQYSTTISNLQGVIEQLEKDHERKLRSMELDKQTKVEEEKRQTGEVLRKLQLKEERLRETLEALEAASRLSETIDQKEMIIGQLRHDLKAREQDIDKLRKKIEDLNASHEGKVDKQIVKSLLISYFASPVDKRADGERLLARFFDFNQEEMSRTGIKIGRDKLAKQSNESFIGMFVEFLESESKPSSENPASGAGGSMLRRLSTNSSSSVGQQSSVASSGPTVELARDLNKRLMNQPAATAINPFVGHSLVSGSNYVSGSVAPSVSSFNSGSSKASSKSSSFENLHKNQLLSTASATQAPVHGSVLVQSQSRHHPHSSVSDIVRDAVENKDKYI